MTRRLVILGTGGTSRDIFDTVSDLNDATHEGHFECIAFLDDNRALWGSRLHGIPIEGPLERARTFDDCLFVNGIGSPTTYRQKESLIGSLHLPVERFATIVHPTASVSRSSRLGRGTVVFQHVTVASNVRIGDHVVVLPNSIVSHDVSVGDFSCIAGGAAISGSVEIGRSCYIGTRAALIGGIRIGDGALVGMGAAVLRDVAPDCTVVGAPARPLRSSAASNSAGGSPPLSATSPRGTPH